MESTPGTAGEGESEGEEEGKDKGGKEGEGRGAGEGAGKEGGSAKAQLDVNAESAKFEPSTFLPSQEATSSYT